MYMHIHIPHVYGSTYANTHTHTHTHTRIHAHTQTDIHRHHFQLPTLPFHVQHYCYLVNIVILEQVALWAGIEGYWSFGQDLPSPTQCSWYSSWALTRHFESCQCLPRCPKAYTIESIEFGRYSGTDGPHCEGREGGREREMWYMYKGREKLNARGVNKVRTDTKSDHFVHHTLKSAITPPTSHNGTRTPNHNVH